MEYGNKYRLLISALFYLLGDINMQKTKQKTNISPYWCRYAVRPYFRMPVVDPLSAYKTT